jgi:hypothetical protein
MINWPVAIVVDLVACFVFYANAMNRDVWIKWMDLSTFNAVSHRQMLNDQRFIDGCRFGAVASGLTIVLLTGFIIKAWFGL